MFRSTLSLPSAWKTPGNLTFQHLPSMSALPNNLSLPQNADRNIEKSAHRMLQNMVGKKKYVKGNIGVYKSRSLFGRCVSDN